jgi:anti-sigma regulatory factor (Ser/Thr protein kinase)
MMVYNAQIGSEYDEVDRAVFQIFENLVSSGMKFDKRILFKIGFMLREILNNAVEHGNHFEKQLRIYCKVELISNQLIVEICDQGEGFDLSDLEAYDLYEPILRNRHRGYETIREMGYEIYVKDNCVTTILNLNKEVASWKG